MNQDTQTRTYFLHGVNIRVSCSAAIAACLDARFRLLPLGQAAADTISFEFRSVADSAHHAIEKPQAPGRPFYELPGGEACAFEAGEQLYVAWGSGVRTACRPGSGTAFFSVVESERGSLFFVSHLLFTIFLMEILKRRDWQNLHAAAFSDNGRAVLIAGTSGSGKSTLSIALLRAKFDYLTDDMVFLVPAASGRRAIGLPEDVDVTERTIGFFPELRFLLDTPKENGFPKWQVPAAKVYGTRIARDAEPGAIVFPRISSNENSLLRAIEPDEALFELAPNVLLTEPRSCQAHLNALTTLAQKTPCYRLETGRDFDRIPQLFREILSAREEAHV